MKTIHSKIKGKNLPGATELSESARCRACFSAVIRKTVRMKDGTRKGPRYLERGHPCHQRFHSMPWQGPAVCCEHCLQPPSSIGPCQDDGGPFSEGDGRNEIASRLLPTNLANKNRVLVSKLQQLVNFVPAEVMYPQQLECAPSGLTSRVCAPREIKNLRTPMHRTLCYA